MITANPLLGTLLHAVGATSAAVCYTPQKGVKGWSWQTYWITQAAFCWLILPILGAYLTIPHLALVLREAPQDAMLRSFLLGAAYGVGGTAFGLAIRHIGFSLTYALSIGLSSVLGTLLPPLVRGEFAALFAKTGAGWVMAGIALGTAGIFLCGLSGYLKETDLADDAARSRFCLSKGLPLCLLAGVLSAVYGFALEAGAPIARIAEAHGAGYFNGNVTYIFANSGAFLTTLAYCLFYNLGHVRMGTFTFTSWAIPMIMLVLISNALGLALREWRGCKPRTWLAVAVSLAVLVSAVLLLTYGNYLGDLAAGH